MIVHTFTFLLLYLLYLCKFSCRKNIYNKFLVNNVYDTLISIKKIFPWNCQFLLTSNDLFVSTIAEKFLSSKFLIWRTNLCLHLFFMEFKQGNNNFKLPEWECPAHFSLFFILLKGEIILMFICSCVWLHFLQLLSFQACKDNLFFSW